MATSFDEFIATIQTTFSLISILNEGIDFTTDTKKELIDATNKVITQLIEQGFTKEQTPYEMFIQNEPAFVQTVIVQQFCVSDAYTNYFIFDYDLVKTLPDNVKKCFVEIYMKTNYNTYRLGGVAFENYPYDVEFLKWIETLEETVLLYTALSQMVTEASEHKHLKNVLGVSLVQEVENNLISKYGELAKIEAEKQKKATADWYERNNQILEREKLLKENKTECYKKYGMTFRETCEEQQKLLQKVTDLTNRIRDENTNFEKSILLLEKEYYYGNRESDITPSELSECNKKHDELQQARVRKSADYNKELTIIMKEYDDYNKYSWKGHAGNFDKLKECIDRLQEHVEST